ncbi:MAG: LuxR C-terminal-related transcriptional regulator [Solirubrobacteraceae bacterium]
MGRGLARSQLAPEWAPALRLALIHDRTDAPAELVSSLVGDGLPPTAGVLSASRVSKLAASPPEVAVLAVDLTKLEGLAVIRELRQNGRDTRIVAVASDRRGVLARFALNAGADAFVSEGAATDALGAAVRAVTAGFVCVPRDTRRLVAKPTFSHREKEVLALLVAGMTNRQIAGRLYLSESTVKTHLGTAFAKLGVRSRKDAVAVVLDPAEGLTATALARVPMR